MINSSGAIKTLNPAGVPAGIPGNDFDENNLSYLNKVENDCFLKSSLGTDNSQKNENKKPKKMSFFNKILTGGLIVTGGLVLLYKGGGTRFQDWLAKNTEILNEKMTDYAKKDPKKVTLLNKASNLKNGVLKKTAETLRALTNITIIKDTVVLKLGDAFRGFYVGAKSKITGQSVEAAEKSTIKPFEAITNWFTSIIQKGLLKRQNTAREKFTELTVKTKKAVETLRAAGNTSEAENLEKLLKTTEDDFQSVFSEAAAKNRTETMHRTLAENAKKSGKDVCELGSAIINSPSDLLSKTPKPTNVGIRKKFKTYRTFENCAEGKKDLRKELEKVTGFFESSENPSTAEKMLKIVKENLGEAEAQEFEVALNNAKTGIENAVKTEEHFFDKLAEYKAGAAVTDTMGLTLPLIPTGYAVLSAKNDDERQSAVLRGGIPGMIGTASGVASTYLMFSGGIGLATAIGSMYLSNKVGGIVDDSLKRAK